MQKRGDNYIPEGKGCNPLNPHRSVLSRTNEMLITRMEFLDFS